MKEELKNLIDKKINEATRKVIASKGNGECAFLLGKLAGYRDIYAELCENEDFKYED